MKLLDELHTKSFLLCLLVLTPYAHCFADRGVLNAPTTFSESIAEITSPIIPAENSPIIDRGTATAIRGLDNMLSPFIGNSPDLGAYEYSLGLPWRGARQFTDLLAYGLPAQWQIGDINQISNFSLLGAPASIAPNSFRLLITRSNPPAFILVTFEELQGENRWNRYAAITSGVANDTLILNRINIRDGLSASLVQRTSRVQLLGARVDDEGVLNILGGASAGDLELVQDDFLTFIRSLYYAWNIQERTQPINITLTSPPAPGLLSVGTVPQPSTSDILIPGVLRGDVTFTSASIIWDVTGDSNLNSFASIRFRRRFSSQWKDAIDLTRTKATGSGGGSTTGSGDRLTGSIFKLSPGTEYEIEVVLSDPDNPLESRSTTRSTTFVTRSIPKVLAGGRMIEVRPTDNLQTLFSTTLPGDTYLFHVGTYNNGSAWTLPASASGTSEKIVLLRPFGDGDVQFNRIDILASYLQIDGFKIGSGGLHGANNASGSTAISITRTSLVDRAFHSVDARGTNWWVSDNNIIGNQSFSCVGTACFDGEGVEMTGRGHVVSYNTITLTSDGISYGDGNIDIHGNIIHSTTDDIIEPDYAWDNYRIWENLGTKTKASGLTFQPTYGGPWYIFRNQITGVPGASTLKMRSIGGAKIIVNNTFVSTAETQASEQFLQPGCIFANNYWRVRSSLALDQNRVGYNSITPSPSVPLLWGFNAYDLNGNNRPWKWYSSLNAAQAAGADKQSFLIDSTLPPQDTTPPVVTLAAPLNNSTISQSIAILATADDNVGVAGVQFQIDGVDLGVEDVQTPYSVAWDISNVSNGPHTIRAIARDFFGVTTISTVANITVQLDSSRPNAPSNLKAKLTAE